MGAYYFPQRDPDEDGILHVPDEYETIQEAIDTAVDGDTVLVAPGVYVENINFEGKGITVASLILTTSDETYIDSTIIDANGEGSVVRFDHDEDENSILIGFTLTEGAGSPDADDDLSGGGVHILESSPLLSHLKIVDNRAEYGAGIYIRQSNPIITDCVIDGNRASQRGAGIYCTRESSMIISNCSIVRNQSTDYGGGLYGFGGCSILLESVTIAFNDAGGERAGSDGIMISTGNFN